jgi:hypothetical protein
MAIESVLVDEGTEKAIAVDSVGAQLWQLGKIGFGAAGNATLISSGNPLPVLESAIATLIGQVAVNPTENTVLDRLKDLLTGIVLNTGSNAIGKLAANDGVIIGAVRKALDAIGFGGATPSALDSVTAAGSVSAAIPCLGKTAVIVHTEYANNTVVAPLSLDFYGNNASPAVCPSAQFSPANKARQTGVLEATYYQGETHVFLNVGTFKEFKVYLESTIAAAVSVWAKAV